MLCNIRREALRTVRFAGSFDVEPSEPLERPTQPPKS